MPPLMQYYAFLLKQATISRKHFQDLTCYRLGSTENRKLTATAIECTAMDVHSHRHPFPIFWFLTEDIHRHAALTARVGLPSKQLFSRTSRIFSTIPNHQLHTYIGP
jgi:hypothetical protein